jgi:hypothetical protein
MCVVKTITIFCNECGAWIEGAADQPLSSLRRDAKAEGWAWPGGGVDYCPKCIGSTSGAKDNAVVDKGGVIA